MSTMARAGQLIGEHMATNNAINIQGSIPAFSVYVGSTISSVTGDGSEAVIAAGSVIYNTGSCWDSSSYTFTADRAGSFNFNGTINTAPFTSSHTSYNFFARINSNDYTVVQCNPYQTAGTWVYLGTPFSVTYHLEESDTVQFYVIVSGGTKTVDIKGTKTYSNISGFYIIEI